MAIKPKAEKKIEPKIEETPEPKPVSTDGLCVYCGEPLARGQNWVCVKHQRTN